MEREVCRVSLGVAMLDSSGRYEARLLDGCHHNGLQIFDPIAWRYEAGRLTLRAWRATNSRLSPRGKANGGATPTSARHWCSEWRDPSQILKSEHQGDLGHQPQLSRVDHVNFDKGHRTGRFSDRAAAFRENRRRHVRGTA